MLAFERGYCLAEDPNDSGTVYAGGEIDDQAVYFRSTDAGATWSPPTTLGPKVSGWSFCHAIAVAPGNASYLYAGGCEGCYIKAWRHSEGVWADITGGLEPLHGRYDYVCTLWIDPDDERTALAGTTKGLFITTDSGETWNAAPIAGAVKDLAYHPVTDTLYAAADTGVHYSEDRGSTWTAMNIGLEYLDVNRLALDLKNGFLFAGTSGASVWRHDLPPAPLWIDAREISRTSGGTVDFTLNAGADHAGRWYLLLGSLSGTAPGIPLPGGPSALPLNWDPFTDLVLGLLNTPAFDHFMGKLDNDGRAEARLDAPPIPPTGAVGLKMAFAYLLDYPFEFASNPVEVTILE
jgi:hypothetical protein